MKPLVATNSQFQILNSQFSITNCTRRAFLAGTAATLALGPSALAAERRRPRIAALTTTYYKYSHSQHIVDRFLEGYGWEGRHHRPAMDVVSLYVEQVGDNDLSRERARRHPQMKIYPTIAEALTQGGSNLAVDGVLLIGEHGKYPVNEKGQTLYPRYEYFQQVVEVYRRSGRTAPLFNDKHLSWNWDYAKRMYDTAKELGFGFMAGSSLPVTWRQPAVDLPFGARVEEVVGIWRGWLDGGDIHVLEAMQSIIERRRGGETGVRAVESLPRLENRRPPTPRDTGTQHPLPSAEGITVWRLTRVCPQGRVAESLSENFVEIGRFNGASTKGFDKCATA